MRLDGLKHISSPVCGHEAPIWLLQSTLSMKGTNQYTGTQAYTRMVKLHQERIKEWVIRVRVCNYLKSKPDRISRQY